MSTRHPTITAVNPSIDSDFCRLAWNSDSGLFYGISDDTRGPGGNGIYSPSTRPAPAISTSSLTLPLY